MPDDEEPQDPGDETAPDASSSDGEDAERLDRDEAEDAEELLDEVDETLVAGDAPEDSTGTEDADTQAGEAAEEDEDGEGASPEVVRVDMDEEEEEPDDAEEDEDDSDAPDEDAKEGQASDDASEEDAQEDQASDDAPGEDVQEDPASDDASGEDAAGGPSKPLGERVSEALDAMRGDSDELKQVSRQVSESEGSLQSLQHLSELLSIRYNPFLEGHEERIFDGDHHDPRSLIEEIDGTRDRGPVPDPAPEAAEPPAQEQADEQEADPGDGPDESAPEPQPEQTDPAPEKDRGENRRAEEADQAAGRGPRARPPPRRRPRHMEPPALERPGEGPDLYGDTKRVSGFGVRETFLVMTWFEHLVGDKDPAVIYVYLDYYREIGWLSEEAYDWMVRLARGIATPEEGASWTSHDLRPQDLIKTHMASLRFFDFLFRINLDKAEERKLQKRLQDILEDDG